MEKGILTMSLLFLLVLAAEGSADVYTGHRLRPHLQIQEEFHGKKDVEIQSPSRRLGLGHEVRMVETKHRRRMVTGHKGGSTGGGGGTVTRPHNTKNGAAALPVPVASVLVLALGCCVALSSFGF